MSLLTAKFAKNIHIKARIYFIFLKNILKETGNSFNPILFGGRGAKNYLPQEENGKNGKNRQAAGLSGLSTKQNLVFDVS